MYVSSIIGVPVEGVAAKITALLDIVTPFLVENTKPREAVMVMAGAYLALNAMLVDNEHECQEGCQCLGEALAIAKRVLDVTAHHINNLEDPDLNPEEN
jgi:hypothetical protein